MRVFLIGVELPDDVAEHRTHDADASQHRCTAACCDEHQGFDRLLPFRNGMLCFRKYGDVVAGVFQCHELPSAGQIDWVVDGRDQPFSSVGFV